MDKSKKSTFDLTIIGYGPAGITGAIYGARKRLNIALIGDLPGGEVLNSGEIENWPGSGETTGIELAGNFIKHLELHKDNVTIYQNKVISIVKKNNRFVSAIDNDQTITSRTIVYAAGRHPRLLNIPGEKEFTLKGVTYCATCDAPLFANRSVAVVGGGNSGAEAVIMLQNIANKIYLLERGDKLIADPILVDNFKNDPKVTILLNASVQKITGEMMVSGLTYKDNNTDKNITLDLQGIFINIGAIPNTNPIKDLIKLDKFGAVPAKRYGETDLDGFFAAGDVTDIRDAQIVVAAGQGCSAALSAGTYLSTHP